MSRTIEAMTRLVTKRQEIVELQRREYGRVMAEASGAESDETRDNFLLLVLEAEDELIQAEIMLAQQEDARGQVPNGQGLA